MIESAEPLATTCIGSGRYGFGYAVMGPILAECCHTLHVRLVQAVADDPSTVALFCARGGLIIRHALQIYSTQIGQDIPVVAREFMASRLTTARLALTRRPEQVERLLSLEFAGRDCRSVACALAGVDAPAGSEWQAPYELKTLLTLLSSTARGRKLWHEISVQAELLRAHFAHLTSTAGMIVLVDTGVFGSIGRYLTAGLDGQAVHSWMLFRANYKKRSGVQLPPGTGLICDQDYYSPWRARSIFRLYWPLLESFFEPDLPSVRHYRTDETGTIVSNLETNDWRCRLIPESTSLRAGANAYLSTLTRDSVDDIPQRATAAWKRLRQSIVFPTRDDVALLASSPRGIDFGFPDTVVFDAATSSGSPLKKLVGMRSSIWPEGAIRQTYPLTGNALLMAMEAGRAARAASECIAEIVRVCGGRARRR